MKSIKQCAFLLLVVFTILIGFQSFAFAVGNNSYIESRTILGKVSNFKAIAKGSDFIDLKWDKTSGVTKYLLYRSNLKSSGYQKIKTLKSSTTSFSDFGLLSGKTYYYKLVPYRNEQRGTSSYPVSVKTMNAPKPSPTLSPKPTPIPTPSSTPQPTKSTVPTPTPSPSIEPTESPSDDSKLILD